MTVQKFEENAAGTEKTTPSRERWGHSHAPVCFIRDSPYNTNIAEGGGRGVRTTLPRVAPRTTEAEVTTGLQRDHCRLALALPRHVLVATLGLWGTGTRHNRSIAIVYVEV
jgi:hypothetical protein